MKQRHEKAVLFLCTGNYYRSRFAEILFNSVAGKMSLPWKVSSRGLALKREAAIKAMNRRQKLALIGSYRPQRAKVRRHEPKPL